jgi:putative PIG3 family NAD(P)H quinone oxidoreductase
MRAVVIARPGGPEVLEIREIDQPQSGPDEIVVRVKASALNRADLLQRQGRYPAPPGAPADIPGIEFAGEVVQTGVRAKSWKLGQRVFGIVGGGAHAEYLTTHERVVAEIPSKLNWTQAAAIPEAFITAHDAMWKQAGLRPCETVLVHAVGSGVGLAAVQLARALNAVAIGTSRTPDKIKRAQELGLTYGIVVGNSLEELPNDVRGLTQGRGADVVLDLVGGAYVNASIKSLALKGRIIFIGTVGGGKAEIDLGFVLGRRIEMRGTVLRARPLEEKIAATQNFADEVVPLFEREMLRATIDSEFPLEQIQAAHKRMESNETFGKVVLAIS